MASTSTAMSFATSLADTTTGCMKKPSLSPGWSHLWISNQAWNTKIKRMNQALYHGLIENAYDYRSAGYRDWIRYADSARFTPALLWYLDWGANPSRLVSNGVSNLPDLFMRMVGDIASGCVEEVVYKKIISINDMTQYSDRLPVAYE